MDKPLPREVVVDYLQFDRFVDEHPTLRYVQFDGRVTEDLSLFALPEDFDFELLDIRIKRIASSLPAMIRIFERPVIHLKEVDTVMPIEAVRKTDTGSVRYAALHSDTWENIDENGFKPRKLLTRTYEDNYSIYENTVFAYSVDLTLSYLAANMRMLRGLLYRNKIVEIDVLERVNHINFFLALGKLHTGYIRHFGQIYEGCEELYSRLNRLYTALSSHLKYPVYRKNRGKFKRQQPVKSTNILAMDKDYHKVFLLLKSFEKERPKIDPVSASELEQMKKSYSRFCVILFIFAASHYGFRCPEETILDFDRLDIIMARGSWKMSVRSTEYGILLNFEKDRKYSILMCPDIGGARPQLTVVRELGEIVRLSPTDERDSLFISVSDIDSFRRFQNLILKGTVMTDDSFETCSFCGGSMQTRGKGHFVCRKCLAEVKLCTCPVTGEQYRTTGLSGYKIRSGEKIGNDNASLLHYRSITELTDRGDHICPLCKRVHD